MRRSLSGCRRSASRSPRASALPFCSCACPTLFAPARLSFEPEPGSSPGVALALLSSTAIINSQMGVVLLGALGTPDEAGLYAIAQRGALLVAFPLMAVNSAIGPTAARLWVARDRSSLQRLVTLSTRAVLLGSLPIALAFILYGQQILTFFFGTRLRRRQRCAHDPVPRPAGERRNRLSGGAAGDDRPPGAGCPGHGRRRLGQPRRGDDPDPGLRRDRRRHRGRNKPPHLERPDGRHHAAVHGD